MLRKIKVYGRLRKFLGQAEFEADARNVIEVISFLKCNFKGIERHMMNQEYRIICGSTEITEDLLSLESTNEIKIVPLAHGNFFFTLGLGLLSKIGAGAIGKTLLGSKLLATVATTALTSIGTSMIVSGVTQMLTPQRQNTNSAASGMDRLDPAALASNYSFTGLSNISQAGVPVNLVFGEIMVGSITVSNGIDTVQVEGEN
jgi:predicted phage tail protein